MPMEVKMRGGLRGICTSRALIPLDSGDCFVNILLNYSLKFQRPRPPPPMVTAKTKYKIETNEQVFLKNKHGKQWSDSAYHLQSPRALVFQMGD